MKKNILYALGRVFQANRELIPWDDVVAVSDKEELSEDFPAPFVHPEEIDTLDYEHIIIFSNKYFEEIRRDLAGLYGLDLKRMVCWRAFFLPHFLASEEKLKFRLSYDRLDFAKTLIGEYEIGSVLETGTAFSKIYCAPDCIREGLVIDNVSPEEENVSPALYSQTYPDISGVLGQYDLLLLWERFDLLQEVIGSAKERYRYILLCEEYEGRYPDCFEEIENGVYGDILINRYTFQTGSWFMLDLAPKKPEKKIGVYVVTHRPYHLFENEYYLPLCVGDRYRNENWLSEKDGDNISRLNEKINECTGLYWIWKNSDKEIVGLSHYRRYFYRNSVECYDNLLDGATIERLLEAYDIILPRSEKFVEPVVYDQLKIPLEQSVLDEGMRILREAIGKHQPEYLRFFDSVLHGHAIYLCNMFVTRKEILDRYCEWLFSFLIEAAEKTDISRYEGPDRRIMGFLAERMMTVWLMGQKLRIKELPYIIWW
ncbi:MAG: DUF4422 domain-containing protein [Lachnospiraceae bacterium]|nr:DUF4422 domain-containing protein [Lachnospiraceae bacterium]